MLPLTQANRYFGQEVCWNIKLSLCFILLLIIPIPFSNHMVLSPLLELRCICYIQMQKRNEIIGSNLEPTFFFCAFVITIFCLIHFIVIKNIQPNVAFYSGSHLLHCIFLFLRSSWKILVLSLPFIIDPGQLQKKKVFGCLQIVVFE